MRRVEDLDRDLAVEAMVVGPIHLPHSSHADALVNPVRADRVAGRQARCGGGEGKHGGLAERAGLAVGGQHRVHLGTQRQVSRAGFVEQRDPGGAVAGQGGVKDLPDLPPPLRRHRRVD